MCTIWKVSTWQLHSILTTKCRHVNLKTAKKDSNSDNDDDDDDNEKDDGDFVDNILITRKYRESRIFISFIHMFACRFQGFVGLAIIKRGLEDIYIYWPIMSLVENIKWFPFLKCYIRITKPQRHIKLFWFFLYQRKLLIWWTSLGLFRKFQNISNGQRSHSSLHHNMGSYAAKT